MSRSMSDIQIYQPGSYDQAFSRPGVGWLVIPLKEGATKLMSNAIKITTVSKGENLTVDGYAPQIYIGTSSDLPLRASFTFTDTTALHHIHLGDVANEKFVPPNGMVKPKDQNLAFITPNQAFEFLTVSHKNGQVMTTTGYSTTGYSTVTPVRDMFSILPTKTIYRRQPPQTVKAGESSMIVAAILPDEPQDIGGYRWDTSVQVTVEKGYDATVIFVPKEPERQRPMEISDHPLSAKRN